MESQKSKYATYAIFALFFLANVALWWSMRGTQAEWRNVPPAPTVGRATSAGFGDAQLAYRMYGLQIQNFGDIGGRIVPLKDYDFERLTDWFFLTKDLDEKSNYIPMMAAYYFGSSQEPEDLDPLIEYLGEAGQLPYKGKWRWLVQAVFLSKFRQENLQKALYYADILNKLDQKMPGWARQMSALIYNDLGENEASAAILRSILATSTEDMQPAEVYHTLEVLCTRVLSEAEARLERYCRAYEERNTQYEREREERLREWEEENQQEDDKEEEGA